MTAPSGKFVDVRYPKESDSPEAAARHASFWVFSGHVTTRFYDADTEAGPMSAGFPYTAHCVFEQDIDSRGLGFVDEGDMFTLQNGDCLEVGTMLNPTSGKEEMYKEYWAGADPLPGSSGKDDAKYTVFASAFLNGLLKGNAVRIGGRIQAVVLQKDDEGIEDVVKAVRWERTATPESKASYSDSASCPGSDWVRDRRSNIDIPCRWICRAEAAVGDAVEFDGLLWQITEVA